MDWLHKYSVISAYKLCFIIGITFSCCKELFASLSARAKDLFVLLPFILPLFKAAFLSPVLQVFLPRGLGSDRVLLIYCTCIARGDFKNIVGN
jgi:hypothetical protein